jgi:predicted transcriptional regulator
VEHCGLRVKQVADLMGVSSSAVSLGIRALQHQMNQNHEVEAAVKALTNN